MRRLGAERSWSNDRRTFVARAWGSLSRRSDMRWSLERRREIGLPSGRHPGGSVTFRRVHWRGTRPTRVRPHVIGTSRRRRRRLGSTGLHGADRGRKSVGGALVRQRRLDHRAHAKGRFHLRGCERRILGDGRSDPLTSCSRLTRYPLGHRLTRVCIIARTLPPKLARATHYSCVVFTSFRITGRGPHDSDRRLQGSLFA